MMKASGAFAVFLAFGVAGCGGGNGESAGTGGGGQSGAGGAAAGQSGVGGQGGSSASAGAAHGGAGASAGSAGSSGHGGSAGSSGKGAGGSPGGAGGVGGTSSGGCVVDADCAAKIPPTKQAGCAEGKCDPGHACLFRAKDADHDGHPTSGCSALDGTPIVVGDDCDDGDATIHPGAWDGPKGDGNPDSCDGVDENCSGAPDEQKLADGSSCICSPGDVRDCSTDSSGKPISWPTGAPTGACKYGAQSCLTSAAWGPCTGAVIPAAESCNHQDDDCNGLVDDGPAPDGVPIDAQYYVYDGDDDNHSGLKILGYVKLHVCSFDLPKTPPDACTAMPIPCALGATVDACCPGDGWKIAAGIPQDDCDDRSPSVFPTAPENCATPADDNCDGTPNEGCKCVPGSSSSCSTTANGDPIVWPTGVPVGSCSYGSALCGSNGQYGQCVGAISPAAVDNCAMSGGKDDNCDGTIDCACSPVGSTDSSVCNQNGSCSGASSVCGPAGYGPCSITPKPEDTCDVGNDDNCSGSPNDGCLHIDGDPCGAAATCNADALWENCSPGVACQCSVAPSPIVDGSFCDFGNSQGACAGGGVDVCTGPDSGVVTCSGLRDPGVASSAWPTSAAPWNASWDWNCDGTIDRQFAKGVVHDSKFHSDPNACEADGLAGGFQTVCQGYNANSGACTDPIFTDRLYLCGDPALPSCTACDCGHSMFRVSCTYDSAAGKCNYASHDPQPTKMGCH